MPVKQHKTVEEFLELLDAQTIEIVDFLRQTILLASDQIGEQIKWNSPAYYFKGELADFDAKEYKRDIVVMNVRTGRILLVFPTGDTIPDDSGILEGKYTDGRRMITIKNLEDAQQKAEGVKTVIQKWVELAE